MKKHAVDEMVEEAMRSIFSLPPKLQLEAFLLAVYTHSKDLPDDMLEKVRLATNPRPDLPESMAAHEVIKFIQAKRTGARNN